MLARSLWLSFFSLKHIVPTKSLWLSIFTRAHSANYIGVFGSPFSLEHIVSHGKLDTFLCPFAHKKKTPHFINARGKTHHVVHSSKKKTRNQNTMSGLG